MTDAAAAPPQPIFLVAIGGDQAATARVPVPAPGSIVVAADSGLDVLDAAGIVAHHVVGDLDSASPTALGRAKAAGAIVHRHEADKDATDLELALALVAEQLAPSAGLRRLVVVGPGGGRLDHLLGDLLLLASPLLDRLVVDAHVGPATVTIVRPGPARRLHGAVGEQVSLLPIGGRATGVTTEGLRWSLIAADLVAGTSRGMSNELRQPSATVRISSGVVAAIQPGTASPPIPNRTTSYDPTPRAHRGDVP